MYYIRTLFILALVLVLTPLSAIGASGINPQIPFEGILRDDKGKLLEGAYDIVFNVYDVATGGSALWTGEYSATKGNPVTLTNGYFRVLLGEGVGNPLTVDFSEDTYYLGITVGTDAEMTPRERLGATPYAFNSALFNGLDITSFLLSTGPGTLTGSSDSPLLTISQSGAGNFLSAFDGETELFAVAKSGRVLASSIGTTVDEVNTFAGPIEILGSESSYFGGDVRIADGNAVLFGNGNGISFSQDLGFDANSLLIAPHGDATASNYVNLMVPGELYISANTGYDGSGTWSPGLSLSESGTMSLYNAAQGDAADRYLDVSFTNGMQVAQGDLRIMTGGVRIGSGAPEEALDVDGQIRSSVLAGGPFDLQSDVNGNIIANTSDERLKRNIEPITDGLSLLLKLQGVRYEWRDTERFGSSTEIGFIAQDVQTVLPEVVRDTGEYLSLNTKNITAVIVEAVKELYAHVDEYMSRTERLEREIESLRAEVRALEGDTTAEPRATEEPPTPVTEEVAGEVVPEAPTKEVGVAENEIVLEVETPVSTPTE